MALQSTLVTLFTEVFEGLAPGAKGTWIVERGEALEETLVGLTAEQASRRISGASSVAAHVIHTIHYLKMSNAQGRGQAFEADWDGSWARQVVTDEEWAEVQSDLVDQKTLLLELMSQPGLPDDAVLGAIANIGHAAFHLGAIRQLVAAAQ